MKKKYQIIIGFGISMALLFMMPSNIVLAEVSNSVSITFTPSTKPPVVNPPTEPGGETPTDPEVPETPDEPDHDLKPDKDSDNDSTSTSSHNNFLPQTNEAQQSYFSLIGWLLLGVSLIIYKLRKEETDNAE